MKAERGFTLIEMLAVLVLLGFLMAFAARLLSDAGKASQQIQQQTNRLDEIAAAHRFIRGMLEHVLPLPLAEQDSQKRIFVGKPDYLNVVAPLPQSIGGGIYIQRLRLQQHTLWVSFAPPPGIKGGTLKSQPLLKGVKHVRFSYKGINSGGHPGGWRSQWDKPDVLPRSVRIEAQLAGHQQWVTQVVTLRLQLSGNSGQ